MGKNLLVNLRRQLVSPADVHDERVRLDFSEGIGNGFAQPQAKGSAGPQLPGQVQLGNPLMHVAQNSSDMPDARLAYMAPYLSVAIGLALPGDE